MTSLTSLKYRRLGLFLLFSIGFFILAASTLAALLPLGDALLRTLEIGVFIFILSAINLFVLIPFFLERQRIFIYIISTILTIAFLTWLRSQTVHPLFLTELVADTRPISELPQTSFILGSHIAVWLLTTTYWLAESWFRGIRERSELRNQHLEAELRFLKAQINPHFLFNTLNNLYSLCLLQDDKAAPMVLKLSNILRYVLDEAAQHTVTLQKEVQILQDFIDLQSLKTDFKQNIHLDTPEKFLDARVPPLLLLTLLENSFKHGNVDTKPTGWVKAELYLKDEELIFEVRNSFEESTSATTDNGIGLKNTRKRLALIYPDRHTLHTNTDKGVFTALIRIPQNQFEP